MTTHLSTCLQTWRDAQAAFQSGDTKKSYKILEKQNEAWVLLKKLSWIADEREYRDVIALHLKSELELEDTKESLRSFNAHITRFAHLTDEKIMKNDIAKAIIKQHRLRQVEDVCEKFKQAIIEDCLLHLRFKGIDPRESRDEDFANSVIYEIFNFDLWEEIFKLPNFEFRDLSIENYFGMSKGRQNKFWALLPKTKLMHLIFSNNNKSNASALAVSVKQHLLQTRITSLGLWQCGFEDAHLSVILPTVEQSRLMYLNLLGNQFTEKGNQMIHEFAQKHPEIHIEYDRPMEIEDSK